LEEPELTKTPPCKEPTVFLNPSSGQVLSVCSNEYVAEWESLALLGKLALSSSNKFASNYNQDHRTEDEIGLKKILRPSAETSFEEFVK